MNDDLDELEDLLQQLTGAKGKKSDQQVGSMNKESLGDQTRREYHFDRTEAIQTVEMKDKEKIQEIETAIETFVQKNNNLNQNSGDKIAIGINQQPLSAQSYHQQPVIVLPITKEQEIEGERKPITFGLRWLVTLSQKLMKIFQGNFKYREK